MNMKNNFLYQTCTEHKGALGQLLALEITCGLLLLAASFLLTTLMQSARLLALGEESSFEAAPALLVLLFVLSLRSLLRLGKSHLLDRLSHHCRLGCRREIHLALLSPATPAAEAATAALEAAAGLDRYFTVVLPTLLNLAITIPLLLAAALALDLITAGIFLLTLPIAPFLLYLIGQVTKERTARQWQELSRLASAFSETLAGLVSLKIFQREGAQQEEIRHLSDGFATTSLKVLQTAFISSFALELITTLSIALAAVSIGFRLLGGSLAFETSFFLLLIIPLYYQPLRRGGICFHAAMEARGAEEKIRALLQEQPAQEGRKGQLQVPPALTAENLTLGYEGKLQPVFRGLDLKVPAGSRLLLTGPSGCGKSTLLKAAAGLMLPREGSLYLNDTDLHKLAPVSRQKIISYLPQEPHIFAATLAENLSLFQEVPTERIRQALRLASLEKWFDKLPAGLDTPLGAGGLSLSHGERKRLGLARIILQNRPLVLLDEPTNGLDEDTEKSVLKALTAFSWQRTVIVVSHRPALRNWTERIIDWEELIPQEQRP